MTSRHVVAPAAHARFTVPAEPWARTSKGFTRWEVLDETTAAVHTGFNVCALQGAGTVPAVVSSYELSFFVLEGAPVLQCVGQSYLLRPGDYGLLPVAVPHSWHNDAEGTARWAEMITPQPRSRFDADTRAVPALPRTTPEPVDVRDPRTRALGHIDEGNMDVGRQKQEFLAASASMRTALLVYSGITVKMMVDSDLGADLSTMFMVAYEPDGMVGGHDHPFEETYLFLEGEAEAEFDGETYRLGPGDVAFAGAGCVHAFRNAGGGRLRWLETQAPQPPRRHSYRFARDWDYLQDVLSEGGSGTGPLGHGGAIGERKE
jgi:quercetin dioxygenase-like cupin family protein